MSATKLGFVSVLLGITVVLSSSACAAPMASAEDGREGATVSVTVQNRADTDAHVSVLQEGHMVHLGFVERGSSETLTIPRAAIQSNQRIRLVADAVASTDWYQSDPVPVDPESDIVFAIESRIDRSTVSVTN